MFRAKVKLIAAALVSAAVLIFADQLLKSLVIQYFAANKSYPVFGQLLQIRLTFNDSAAFSMGFGLTWIFTIVSSLAALAMLWYLLKIESRSWAIMLGVALGGVVGNLIDRLTREPGFGIGRVVDFIQIPFNFPLFNLADSAIVVIASLTVIRIMRGDRIGKARG